MIGPAYKVACEICAKWLAPSSLRGHKENVHKVCMTTPADQVEDVRTTTPEVEEVTVVPLVPEVVEEVRGVPRAPVIDRSVPPVGELINLGTQEVANLLEEEEVFFQAVEELENNVGLGVELDELDKSALEFWERKAEVEKSFGVEKPKSDFAKSLRLEKRQVEVEKLKDDDKKMKAAAQTIAYLRNELEKKDKALKKCQTRIKVMVKRRNENADTIVEKENTIKVLQKCLNSMSTRNKEEKVATKIIDKDETKKTEKNKKEEPKKKTEIIDIEDKFECGWCEHVAEDKSDLMIHEDIKHPDEMKKKMEKKVAEEKTSFEKVKRDCRFFKTRKGCFQGDKCPFTHRGAPGPISPSTRRSTGSRRCWNGERCSWLANGGCKFEHGDKRSDHQGGGRLQGSNGGQGRQQRGQGDQGRQHKGQGGQQGGHRRQQAGEWGLGGHQGGQWGQEQEGHWGQQGSQWGQEGQHGGQGGWYWANQHTSMSDFPNLPNPRNPGAWNTTNGMFFN